MKTTKKYIHFEKFIISIWKKEAYRHKIMAYQRSYHTTSMAILWCLWHDYHHSPMPIKTIIRMIQYAKWYEQKYIIPIRNHRNNLKKNTGAYKQTLHHEIQTEMRLCRLMAHIFPTPKVKKSSQPPTWGFNSKTYCTLLRIPYL